MIISENALNLPPINIFWQGQCDHRFLGMWFFITKLWCACLHVEINTVQNYVGGEAWRDDSWLS